MEDAKSATDVVFQALVDTFNSEDLDGHVKCFNEKCVVLAHEHGVVLKGRTEVRNYVAGKLQSLFSKGSNQGTLDFQMMGDDYAVGCYRVDVYDNQEAIVKRFTEMIVWQKVAGAWRILRLMYAALI